MTVLSLTAEQAAFERERLLRDMRFHRQQAKRARIALDLLEADCARVGIRLIREPRQTHEGETSEPATRSDHP